MVAREGEIGKSAEDLGDSSSPIATDLFALEVVLEPKEEMMKKIIPGHAGHR